MSIELKVKTKHLGEEAKIIRFEERKQINVAVKQLNYIAKTGKEPTLLDMYEAYCIYFRLHSHRTNEVRNEVRSTFLARAYLAGQPYKIVEQNCKDTLKLKTKIIPRTIKMIKKYSKNPVETTDIQQWFNE